jgi:hypothetical protein
MGRPPIGKEKLAAHNRAQVKRWKEKNPEKLRAQKERATTRKRIERTQEKRRMDPTGELAYEPLDGIDKAPDAKEPDLPDSGPDPDPRTGEGYSTRTPDRGLERSSPMDNSQVPASPGPALQGRPGIIEPPGFAEEAKRHNDFHNLKSLHDIRLRLEGKTPPGIEIEL